MKFSGGTIVLVIVALALIFAMVITLTLGGNRSRHGYGHHPPELESGTVSGAVDLFFQ